MGGDRHPATGRKSRLSGRAICDRVKVSTAATAPEPRVRAAKLSRNWSLVVSDNGVGISENSGAGSFGSKLVSALAAQLGASFNLSSDANGTRYQFDRAS